MNKNNKKFIGMLALSVFIHLGLFFFHSIYKSEDRNLSPQKKQQVLVTLKQKEEPKKVSQLDSKKQPEPIEKPAEKQKPEPKIEEVPDLPDQYVSGEESQSMADVSQRSDKGKAAQITGERVKVQKQKSLKAKKTVKEAGAIGTISQVDGIVVTESQDVVTDEELDGSLYDLGEAVDEEVIDSRGDEEKGIASDNTVEHAEHLDELMFNEVGNTILLSDTQLSNSFVKDPLSEKRSKELKVINGYLKEIVTLFESRWENPLTPAQQMAKTGVMVRFTVSLDGFITEPYVYLHSDFPVLDESVLRTLQALNNHKLNWHKSYIEKYRHLNLTWSGSGHKYEIMPYETE